MDAKNVPSKKGVNFDANSKLSFAMMLGLGHFTKHSQASRRLSIHCRIFTVRTLSIYLKVAPICSLIIYIFCHPIWHYPTPQIINAGNLDSIKSDLLLFYSLTKPGYLILLGYFSSGSNSLLELQVHGSSLLLSCAIRMKVSWPVHLN